MSTALLGEHFDIHGGGMDLVFPHHENEIAQSCGATHQPFVNLWMHNGFVNIDDEKMSKSLGNFFTIRDVLQHYQPEVVRYFILSSHYRSPLNYSDAQLDAAKAALDRLYLVLRDVPAAETVPDDNYTAQFHAAMQDDFNTPVAMAVLFDLARDANRLKDNGEHTQAAARVAQLLKLGGILGLLQQSPADYLRGSGASSDDAEIEQLITARNAARKARDFAEADRLRDELSNRGVVLEDKPGGVTEWRRG